MKVIGPLFLDELKEELEWILMTGGKDRKRMLEAYHAKLGRLQFLDPACGSGNFLIIAYRELRRLEIRCMAELRRMEQGARLLSLNVALDVKVRIDHFHGIEILEFPVDIARVSMHLMEHFMNLEMEKEFGDVYPSIPLKRSSGIVQANALTTPWESIVNAENIDYIFGNPPFIGARMMDRASEQKEEIKNVFNNLQGSENLDYVTCWFKKAAEFSLNTKIKCCFVSTNSICQGEQVGILWSFLIKKYKIYINFAYTTFKWENEGRNNAGIFCIIIGFSHIDTEKKKIFNEKREATVVEYISPYLIPNTKAIVLETKIPICKCPKMNFGNQPRDGGNFILDDFQKNKFIEDYPSLKSCVKKYIGSEEFIHNKTRWCLWLKNVDIATINENRFLRNIVSSVKKFRLQSKAKTTQGYARVPHLFAQITQPDNTTFLIVPSVSTVRRKYIPIGFCGENTIASNAAQIIPNATLYDFGIITSNFHMVWMRTVCGRLGVAYRYSRDLCYNTFPWPSVTSAQKERIQQLADGVLAARDLHLDMCLADMYDPETMPADLKAAHDALDLAVDDLYRPGKPFESDEDRLQLLFAMYERLVKAKEGTLHA